MLVCSATCSARADDGEDNLMDEQKCTVCGADLADGKCPAGHEQAPAPAPSPAPETPATPEGSENPQQ